MEGSSSKGGEEGLGDYNSSNIKRARLRSTLSALLQDPILADVPKSPTLSDVDTLISLELGSAMRVSVLKLDGSSFGIAISLRFSRFLSPRRFIEHLGCVLGAYLFLLSVDPAKRRLCGHEFGHGEGFEAGCEEKSDRCGRIQDGSSSDFVVSESLYSKLVRVDCVFASVESAFELRIKWWLN